MGEYPSTSNIQNVNKRKNYIIKYKYIHTVFSINTTDFFWMKGDLLFGERYHKYFHAGKKYLV
jgi:hypothetical protein